jgi:hypothetical protein
MERTAPRGILRSKWARFGLALVILNEIRGVAVVISLLTVYLQ